MPRDVFKMVQIAARFLKGREMHTQTPIDLKLLVSRCHDRVLHVDNARWILIKFGDYTTSVQIDIKVLQDLLSAGANSCVGERSDACHDGMKTA